MASDTVTKKMREDATCSICQKLMTEPTSIDCGHSFCNSCILEPFELRLLFSRRTRRCPLCQTPFTRSSCRPNKQLQNLIKALKNMDDKNLCEEHGEQLHLFCEDDSQLICWCCERSPQHKGHATLLVTDACKVYKEKLQKTVATLRNLEEECQSQMKFTAMRRTECERTIENQKQKIQSDFRNLQRFLLEEEKSHLWRMEMEKKKVLKRLQDNEANLQEQMQQLKKHIEELEEKCRGSAKNLLQDVKDTLDRSSAIDLVKPKEVLLELDAACNVSELYFDVTKMLRRYQANVILDPDTAHPTLILSKDQRQVAHGCVQKKPDSPGRFGVLPCVLGSERFTSGRHYFEVDVGEGTQWDVGVCLETMERNVDTIQGPQSGFWAVRLCKDKGYVALSSPLTPLRLKEHLEVLGLFLDYDAGFVSFYNVKTGSHIYTFPRASFSQALRPYFQVYPYSPLFLPPPDE